MNEGERLRILSDMYFELQEELKEFEEKAIKKLHQFEAFKSIFKDAKKKYNPFDNHAPDKIGGEDKPEKGRALGLNPGNESGLS